MPELYLHYLEIDKTRSHVLPLFFRDIISFSADNISGNMITYDEKANIFYVPGRISQFINSRQAAIEIIKVSPGTVIGFAYIGGGIILYSDKNGNVFRAELKRNERWEERLLFRTRIGQKPFTAMTANQKNIYLYSQRDNGIYRFDHSGRPEAFINTGNINVAAIDIKSNYLYILDSSGLIILADYRQNRIEVKYRPDDRHALSTSLLVKQTQTETEIILSRQGAAGSLHYAIYPLSSLHRMIKEEGYIRSVYPPIAGCYHVLSDSRGRVIFPVRSSLIDLNTVQPGRVTVTGMIHNVASNRIVVISAIDD
ncbi:MAG: hypothetical protein FWC36_00115 [Spirochaetes bacterium]|nr:hypothetical protein [Spirochaetota bacterium]